MAVKMEGSRIALVTKYVTPDGKAFDHEHQAKHYLMTIDLENKITELCDKEQMHASTSAELLKFILKNQHILYSIMRGEPQDE